jgi:hypothetical protein
MIAFDHCICIMPRIWQITIAHHPHFAFKEPFGNHIWPKWLQMWFVWETSNNYFVANSFTHFPSSWVASCIMRPMCFKTSTRKGTSFNLMHVCFCHVFLTNQRHKKIFVSSHTYNHTKRWKKKNQPKSTYFIGHPFKKQLVKSSHSKHAWIYSRKWGHPSYNGQCRNMA